MWQKLLYVEGDNHCCIGPRQIGKPTKPEQRSGRPTYYFPKAFQYFIIYVYTTDP